MAYQSRKIVLCGVVFGALKSIASCFYYLSESEMVYHKAILLTSSQFAVNALLGMGIAYLVVKHSENWKLTFVTTFLAVLTFMTSMFEPMIVI